jgi:four helix bundle protein
MSSNYRAACCGRSLAEFIAKLGTAVEEADETEHWLWVLGQLGVPSRVEFTEIAREATELRAILSASHGTARRNRRRHADEDR